MATLARFRLNQSLGQALRAFTRARFVWLAVLIVPSFFSHAATPSSPAATSAPAPVIAIDQMRFDFGKITHEQTVTHRFIVSNAGTATLHIKDVKPVCGCTSAVIGKTNLEPGETTAIEATFTPEKAFSGAVRKTILVLCDDPAHPKLTLRFAAEVIDPSAPTGSAP